MVISKYIDIANIVKQRISNGTYQAGDALPGQKAMAEEFQTSRVTIQRALDILSSSGLINRRQGSGAYVSQFGASMLDANINQFIGTTKLFKDKAKVDTKTLKFLIRLPDEEEANKLLLAISTPVYDILRLRYINDIPYSIEHSIMPTTVITGITEKVLEQSIYEYIQTKLKLKIGSAFRIISADKPNNLDKKYLDCTDTDPVLQISQVVYLRDGAPFEYSHTRHRYDQGSIYVSHQPFSKD